MVRQSRRIVGAGLALLTIGVFTSWRADGSSQGGGLGHSVVATTNGDVFAWGLNNNGQLGDGTVSTRSTPTAVSTLTAVTDVAAGSYHSLALDVDGRVWTWGDNAYGQLGDGTTTDRTQPTLLSLTDVVAIAAGDSHSLALRSNGDLYAWGRNTNGQIGNGTTTHQSAPTVVLLNVQAVGAGGSHSLAVKTDGTGWSWGLNSNGQLGDSTTTQRLSPVQMSGVSGALAVAGGAQHTLVLLADGTMKATGWNGWGQLGIGTSSQQTTAAAVSSLSNVAAIAAGATHSLAITSAGAVYAWGANGWGQLGDGTTTWRTAPTLISALTGITKIGAGANHSVAVTSAGVVYTWGYNGYSQLGEGTTLSRSTPEAISGSDYDWNVGTPVLSVPSGTYTTARTVVVTASTSGAELHYTQDGTEPTLSDAAIASGSSVTVDVSQTLKVKAWKAPMPESRTAVGTYTLQAAAPWISPVSGTYTSARTVTVGTSSPGATIRYTTDGTTPTESSGLYTGPFVVATTTMVKAIAVKSGWTTSPVGQASYTMNFGTLDPPVLDPAGGSHLSATVVTMTALDGATIRFTTDGTTPGTGSPAYAGPVTVSTTSTLKARAFHPDYTASGTTSATYTITVATPTFSPTAGAYTAGHVISVATATAGATLRYTQNGAEPTETDPTVPSSGLTVGNYVLKVKAFKAGTTPSATATATYAVTGELTTPRVIGGDRHSLAIRSDGVMFAWGNNVSGQLGTGTTTARLLPTVVNGLTGAVRASAGQDYSLATAAGQQSWAWGSNGSGRLGDGTTTTRILPVAPTGLTGTVAVVAGAAHGLAINADGTVVAWGTNTSGQIGDGSTTQRTSPVAVTGLTNVTDVAAGSAFSLAVTSDGTAWSWGANGNGQLGTGSTTGRTSPGSIPSLTNVSAVAAGMYHGLARLSDGTVRAWGHNGSGQLGDGTITQRLSPVAVTGLSGITSIAAGGTHSLALDESGVVWAWGNNGNGQLGDGTTTQRLVPVMVTGLPAIGSIAAGSYHSLAVGTDGSVWAWGRNDQGQLGDGTQTNRSTPVQIAGAGMAWKIAAPALSVAQGLYTASFSVIVTEADTEATIHYTTDGSTPTTSDPIVLSGSAVSVDQSLTLKARAFKPGAIMSEVTAAAYELKVVTPLLTPASGAYEGTQSVTIATTTPDAALTFTVDGTNPTDSSAPYTGVIPVDETLTVKARAFKAGWTSSDTGAASYWVSAGTAATPVISPASGSYPALTLATVSSTDPDATLRYTLDGTEPTSTSPRYVQPILLTQTTTIRSKAFRVGHTASATASATISIDPVTRAPRPVIAPGGGWFHAAQTVTVTASPGATLRYRLDGIDPTESDPVVPAGGLTIDRSRLLAVRAWEDGLEPSAVSRADFAIIGAVAAGQYHSLALAADGGVWTWGINGVGQLGDGTATNRATPVQVLTDVAGIAAGRYFSLAVKRDGTVWAWGHGASGQLGQGNTFNSVVPVQVSGITTATAVAAGSDHALALLADGTVRAWGRNDKGQLGDGTTVDRTTPVAVIGLRGVRSLAGGDDFSLAVQDDGSAHGWVWAWGGNANGQLADGTTESRVVPTRIADISGAAQVAAGLAFGVARLQDGTVRSWGANADGQLGIGTTGAALGVHVVEPLVRIRDVSAGLLSAYAVDDAGRLWAWGYNGSRQFGMAPYTQYGMAMTSPQLIIQATRTLAAAGGWLHTIALQADGSLRAFGSGIATSSESSVPDDGVQVAGFSAGDQSVLLSDQDNDGVLTWEELARGTDPLNADSNGNGLSDRIEIETTSAGVHPDEDGDGVATVAEVAAGTDPFAADSDGDGVSDRLDAFPLDPTRHEPLVPTPGDTTAPVITLIEPTNAVPVP